MAVLELFALILARFGAEVPAAQLTAVQQTLMQAVLEHPRPAVRKRAITAVGVLVGLLDDAVLGQLLAQLVAAANSSSGNPERLKTVIACLTQICRTTGHRLGAAFEPIVQLFLKQARAEDDDELKELAVQGVEVLLYRSPLSDTARERLRLVFESQDGFEIARRDLLLRGPGELLGARQSGLPMLRYADLERDADLVGVARELAARLLDADPAGCEAVIARWLTGRGLFTQA